MTKRLEDAIKRLSPMQIEELTSFAEKLAPVEASLGGKPTFKWVGALADAYPEHRTGVDAAHAAVQMWRKSIERSLDE